VSELDKKVLEAIERRRLAPRPPIFFLAKRSVFWVLAAVSLAVGAIAVAVIIYGVTDQFATGGRGFEEMPLDDIFEYLPLAWFAIAALFLASAVFGLKHTRRGYRYPTAVVFGAAMVASVVLGGLLYAANIGWHVHEFLESISPAYERLTESADDEWDQPDEGRLAGRVVGYDGKSTVTLQDFDGVTWTVSVEGATLNLDEPLGSDEDVAILGERTGPTTFKAHSIGEWD